MRPAYIYPDQPNVKCDECPYEDEDSFAIPDFLRPSNIVPLSPEQRQACSEWLMSANYVARTDGPPCSNRWLPKTMDDTAWAMLAYQERLKFDKAERIKEERSKFFAAKKAELEELKAKGLKPVRRRKRK